MSLIRVARGSFVQQGAVEAFKRKFYVWQRNICLKFDDFVTSARLSQSGLSTFLRPQTASSLFLTVLIGHRL